MTTETDYVGVMIKYHGIGHSVTPDMVVTRKAQPTYLTTQALTSGAWSDATTGANGISSQGGQLEPGHFYALSWAWAYSTNGVAIRFRHADFAGAKPGGMMARTASHRKGMLDFSERGWLPVFSAASPLIPECFAAGTDTPVIVVGVIDLGTSLTGNSGVEDFFLASGSVTNGGTLTLLAIVAGDSGTVQDGRGQPTLSAMFLTGAAPLRGQLRSTDPACTPNPIEIPNHCTVAGDYITEIKHPETPMVVNSLINCYASA